VKAKSKNKENIDLGRHIIQVIHDAIIFGMPMADKSCKTYI